jgi:hypothetical protein
VVLELYPRQSVYFVCLFVVINPKKLFSASRPGREVKPLGVYPPAPRDYP